MFDDLKTHNNQVYSGMVVNSSHSWDYRNAIWEETKISVDKWKIKLSATKHRNTNAPEGSGVPTQTDYHWLILADQIVTKTTANEYKTLMQGIKLKVGHKRPYWKGFSYTYPEQQSPRQKVISFLRETILELEKQEAAISITEHTQKEPVLCIARIV